jgi:hypothetical protein
VEAPPGCGSWSMTRALDAWNGASAVIEVYVLRCFCQNELTITIWSSEHVRFNMQRIYLTLEKVIKAYLPGIK